MKTVTYEEEGKTISIMELPESSVKEKYMGLVEDQSAKICIIAVQRGELWAAHIGYPSFDELKKDVQSLSLIRWMSTYAHERMGVIMFGDMLPEDIAREMFPDWRGKPYRTNSAVTRGSLPQGG